MSSLLIHPRERVQTRWVIAALAIALFFHAGLAGLFGFYHLRALEIPSLHTPPTGPFTIKSIEIDPNALKSPQSDPIAKLPVAEPPKSPSSFNLDTRLVEKALQAPLPALSSPALPEPNRVIAQADVTQVQPFAESDTAKVTAEISKVQPAMMDTGPISSSKLADDLISASPGPAQPGLPSGAQLTGNGTSGHLPGFADLAPGFRAGGASLSKLPEPVLLRLPADVLFDFDSATLKPEAGTLLSQAVGMITKYPSADVQIDGYSDSFGRPDYNLTLSQQRAQAVQNWLQAQASSSSFKFRAQGHGSADYVVSPQGSIDQQQANRRVEILIQALAP
jgi:outer membrane protein OmpA-like peptidoglycan-associated protein